MKKIFLKAVLGVCLVASVAACSDQFLQEKRDYNRQIPIDIYSDPVQANAVFGKLYRLLAERVNTPQAALDPLMRQANASGGQQYSLADELQSGITDGVNFVGNERWNGDGTKPTRAGNHIGNPPYWNHPSRGGSNANFNNLEQRQLFAMVYHLNNLIIEIDRTGRVAYDNSEFWDRLKGQAIFARAWVQFDALRFYGGVPFYSTETEQPDQTIQYDRMPVQEEVEKICADFEAAASLLPAKWENEKADYGRFTSVAAWAMISRVRIFAASPVVNASWDNPGGKRWQAALDASLKAKTEADAAGYGTNVVDINSWDRAFYSYNNAFNPEAIITFVMSNSPTIDKAMFNKWESIIRPGVVAHSNGGGIRATNEAMMKFPMANGKRATAANGYDDNKFYRNRDPRFYKTFAFLRSKWPGVEHSPLVLFAYRYGESDNYRYTDGSAGNNGAMGKSRALVWKMSNPAVPRQSESTASTDIMGYRYAEILLNIAESYAAQGNTAKTVEFLTAVRNRVGAGLEDLAELTDRYSLIEAVLNERAVEFAYEGHRANDMRRWLLFEGGAGFDPRLVSNFNTTNNGYDPEEAYGLGWKLYNGNNGRPTYTKTDNVLTRLRLERFSGKRHTTRIWAYDLETIYPIDDPMGGDVDNPKYPLYDDPAFLAVTPITKDMTEAQRNAAFDTWEAFLQTEKGSKMRLIDPGTEMGTDRRYDMDSGTSLKNLNFMFAWRGWYNMYPLHYDLYTVGDGNSWITQNVGWMRANAAPTNQGSAEQNGTYEYCTIEE